MSLQSSSEMPDINPVAPMGFWSLSDFIKNDNGYLYDVLDLYVKFTVSRNVCVCLCLCKRSWSWISVRAGMRTCAFFGNIPEAHGRGTPPLERLGSNEWDKGGQGAYLYPLILASYSTNAFLTLALASFITNAFLTLILASCPTNAFLTLHTTTVHFHSTPCSPYILLLTLFPTPTQDERWGPRSVKFPPRRYKQVVKRNGCKPKIWHVYAIRYTSNHLGTELVWCAELSLSLTHTVTRGPGYPTITLSGRVLSLIKMDGKVVVVVRAADTVLHQLALAPLANHRFTNSSGKITTLVL